MLQESSKPEKPMMTHLHRRSTALTMPQLVKAWWANNITATATIPGRTTIKPSYTVSDPTSKKGCNPPPPTSPAHTLQPLVPKTICSYVCRGTVKTTNRRWSSTTKEHHNLPHSGGQGAARSAQCKSHVQSSHYEKTSPQAQQSHPTKAHNCKKKTHKTQKAGWHACHGMVCLSPRKQLEGVLWKKLYQSPYRAKSSKNQNQNPPRSWVYSIQNKQLGPAILHKPHRLSDNVSKQNCIWKLV